MGIKNLGQRLGQRLVFAWRVATSDVTPPAPAAFLWVTLLTNDQDKHVVAINCSNSRPEVYNAVKTGLKESTEILEGVELSWIPPKYGHDCLMAVEFDSLPHADTFLKGANLTINVINAYEAERVKGYERGFGDALRHLGSRRDSRGQPFPDSTQPS